jgi:tetratricopeptide (TPR) repeat protein
VSREIGDYELARDRFERALRIFEDADEGLGSAVVLSRLGNLAGMTNEMPRAYALLEAALRHFRRVRDSRGIGQTICNLGYWIAIGGDMRRGREMVERSEAMFREDGDRPGLYCALSHLGALALIQGDLTTGRRALTEEVAVQRLLGARTHVGWSLLSLAEAVRRSGDDPADLIAEAREHFLFTSRPDGIEWCEQLGKQL